MTTRTEPGSSPVASAPSDALVGKHIHKYDIVRVIGRGGMGTVYEALNTAIGKRVAMKFIDAETVQNTDAVARFQREAQAASAVESAHIVDIFDSGMSEEGQPYIVMELLRGEDLGHRIKRCGRLDLPEAVHVTAQILRGLHRAHKAGIVHRDLKPDNIFLVDRDDDPNFAKILDFGISKVRRRGETPVHTLTRQGTVLGTPFYMSPEQAQAQPDVDARSDLWSVGAILYECLTGRPPYMGATYEQVIVNICMNDADDVRVHNPAVPEPVAQVIARALARDREARFPDARAFLDALRTGSGGLVSSRRGAFGSEDGLSGVSSSDPGNQPISIAGTATTPGGSGRHRTPSIDDPALDATVKFNTTPPDRDRSASIITQRRAAAIRQRRMSALVAISALFVGGIGAYLGARMWVHPSEASPRIPATSAMPVESATAPVPPASAAQPVVEPATPPAADSADGKTKGPTKGPHGTGPVTMGETPKPPAQPVTSGGSSPPPSVKTAVPRPSETAAPTTAPTTQGVAPGLHLKTD